MTTTQNTAAHTPTTVIAALLPHLIQDAIAQARSDAWMDKDGARNLVRVLNAATVSATDNLVSVRLPLTRIGQFYGHKATDLLNTVVRLVADTDYALPSNARVDQVLGTQATLTW